MSIGVVNPENTCANLEVREVESNNKLEDLFDMQNKLQRAYGNDIANFDPITQRPQFIKDMVLALTDELHELLNRIPWKPWKVYKTGDFLPEGDELKEIKMEIVDILHFFINICSAFNMPAQELYDYYISKNKENLDRIDRGYSKGA